MKKTFIFVLVLFFSFQTARSQQSQTDAYQFYVNLKTVKNDMLNVELIAPKINSDKAMYRFPAMVPGTYAVYNFGRFIHNFKAFDINGSGLSVSKTDTNSWEISGASNLYKITYNVEDTYDSQQGNPVFEPVGTNIEADTNYVINNHGFFGYFDGYQKNNYMLRFTKPQGFYGATSLNVVERNGDEETFSSPGYNFLVDNPIMFSAADTASVPFEEANVMISVYSPGKGMNAPDIAADLKPLLSAIRDYLGGKLPTDRYNFIFYFTSKPSVSGANGALEHNMSSMYYMPDVPASYKDYMLKLLVSTCAHEFMHIVTPLNLHSEEIGNFDFNNPVMSEHLWLYEGTTEYAAYYIQLRQGLMTLKEYVDEMNNKLKGSARYNDTLAFTELSKGALDQQKAQYGNVYEKGALIGLCLDILIRSESNGTQGLKDVIAKLQQKYGKDRSFKDDDLFNDFTELTSPKISEFFANYVAGSRRLPYKEIFDLVGLTYESTPYQSIDFGGAKMGFDQQTRRLKILEVDENNSFVKSLGVKKDDELVSVQGKTINFANIRELFGSVKNQIKAGDDFEMEVARIDKNGNESTVKLSAKVTKTKTSYDGKISVNETPNGLQLKIRNAWMGK
jgi:predicted metalloprotease with PDZ domain